MKSFVYALCFTKNIHNQVDILKKMSSMCVSIFLLNTI